MDGFIGEYYHTIDTKGRVIIPQKYREDLGDTFILSKGLDGCLWIHPMDEWREFTAKLRELSTIDKESRQFKRFFMSGATECEFDKQGRILVRVWIPELNSGVQRSGMWRMTWMMRIWKQSLPIWRVSV